MHLSYLPEVLHRIVFSFSKTLLMKSFSIWKKKVSPSFILDFFDPLLYIPLPPPLCFTPLTLLLFSSNFHSRLRYNIISTYNTYRRYNRTSIWCWKFPETIKKTILQAIMGKKLYATPLHVMMMPLTFRMTLFSPESEYIRVSYVRTYHKFVHTTIRYVVTFSFHFLFAADRSAMNGEISNIPSYMYTKAHICWNHKNGLS